MTTFWPTRWRRFPQALRIPHRNSREIADDVFAEINFRNPGLMVDGHRGPVLDCLSDIVDVNVVPEDTACVRTKQFEWHSVQRENNIGDT